MRIIGILLAGSAALLAPAAQAQAAAAAPTAAHFNARATVEEFRRLIAQNYVLPEARAKIGAALTAGLNSGRYNVTDPELLVERVNADLRAAAHDRHLYMNYNPEQAAILAKAPADGSGDENAPPPAEERAGAVRANHGISDMRLLPGNVRYVNVSQFVWVGRESEQAIDDAMRFLKNGDAAIIDLRFNGGGDERAVRRMISYFLAPETPLVTAYFGEEVEKRVADGELPGRMIGKPLYVLTSNGSASAAEEFAGHVAGYRLGQLIGDTTAGAGFHNNLYALPGGFVGSVSYGRAVLASTGKDWERVGIAPTKKVDPAQALEVAQIDALTRLGASAKGARAAAIKASLDLLNARLNPAAPGLPLASYAGTYGERIVGIRDGKLTYRRGAGMEQGLMPLGGNEFLFENNPSTRVRFVLQGNRVGSMELLRPDGNRIAYDRTS